MSQYSDLLTDESRKNGLIVSLGFQSFGRELLSPQEYLPRPRRFFYFSPRTAVAQIQTPGKRRRKHLQDPCGRAGGSRGSSKHSQTNPLHPLLIWRSHCSSLIPQSRERPGAKAGRLERLPRGSGTCAQGHAFGAETRGERVWEERKMVSRRRKGPSCHFLC